MATVHPEFDQARVTALEDCCRKAMRTLYRKQSSSSNAGPGNRVSDELAVKKQAVLVVSKIREGRFSSVSFRPESQHRIAHRCQLLLDFLRERGTEENLRQGEHDHRCFRHPAQLVNAVRKPCPKRYVGRSRVKEISNLEKHRQPAPVPQDMSKS